MLKWSSGEGHWAAMGRADQASIGDDALVLVEGQPAPQIRIGLGRNLQICGDTCNEECWRWLITA